MSENITIEEEFKKNLGLSLLEKVEVTIGTITQVTEFTNGESVDYIIKHPIKGPLDKMVDDCIKELFMLPNNK